MEATKTICNLTSPLMFRWSTTFSRISKANTTSCLFKNFRSAVMFFSRLLNAAALASVMIIRFIVLSSSVAENVLKKSIIKYCFLWRNRLGNHLACKRFEVQTPCRDNVRPIIARVDQTCKISLIITNSQ